MDIGNTNKEHNSYRIRRCLLHLSNIRGDRVGRHQASHMALLQGLSISLVRITVNSLANVTLHSIIWNTFVYLKLAYNTSSNIKQLFYDDSSTMASCCASPRVPVIHIVCSTSLPHVCYSLCIEIK